MIVDVESCDVQILPQGSFGSGPISGKNWSIGILDAAELLDFPAGRFSGRQIITAVDVTDRPAQFVADPFVLKRADAYYLFFEAYDPTIRLGVICVSKSVDLNRWEYVGTALQESCHLSYPFVFEWESRVYMIPETKHAREVRLYEATEFPLKWRIVDVLAKGKYADATLLQHAGKWWMFSAFYGYNLRILYSDTPHGPWKPHRFPIVSLFNKRRGRPGGRFIRCGEDLIRLSQDNNEAYGHRVRAWRVCELSETRYREEPLCDAPFLEPGRYFWNSHRTHHADAWQKPDGSWMAVVDGTD